MTHGHSSGGDLSPTYRSWKSMLGRCRNNAKYKLRGIVVCDRWLSFENFLADMGERPEGKTLDRYPNQNGNYESGNCRWATVAEQNRNRRDNNLITLDGRTQCAEAWSREKGIPVGTIKNRVKRDFPPEKILSMSLLSLLNGPTS